MFFQPSAFPQGEEKSTDAASISTEKILADIRLIWPDGKCADHFSGDKNYMLVSFACSSNYTADNRKSFLDAMLGRGWKLTRENYHIDRNSASYYYKFQVDLEHDIYFKLFFRDPDVVWPLHENERPQIMILLNDVQSLDELKLWEEVKLPLTISVSLLTADRDVIIKKARELNYDIWLYIPDFIEEWELTKKNTEKQPETGKASEGNAVPQANAEGKVNEDAGTNKAVSEILKKNPEHDFPYSGLSISGTNPVSTNIESLRALFKTMKKEGLKKFAGPRNREIQDTAQILRIENVNQTYYMNSGKDLFESTWQSAYENSKLNKYSLIILDVRDIEARSYLLKMVSETVSFIDFTTIGHGISSSGGQ